MQTRRGLEIAGLWVSSGPLEDSRQWAVEDTLQAALGRLYRPRSAPLQSYTISQQIFSICGVYVHVSIEKAHSRVVVPLSAALMLRM